MLSDFSLLAGLGASAFLSATLLPGNSELAFGALLALRPALWLPALIIAALANTAGGLTSFWLGRLARKPAEARWLPRLERYGAPLLLLSWVPLIGDALCVAAGWLRLPPLPVALWMLVGKATRYAAIALFTIWFIPGR